VLLIDLRQNGSASRWTSGKTSLCRKGSRWKSGHVEKSCSHIKMLYCHFETATSVL